jgi:drug/metabolite transporter (DMT)-like permease
VLLVSVIVSIAGQFCLKLGAVKLGRVEANNLTGHILGVFTTPEILLGLLFYALSAVTYILLLTRVKLSVIGPAVAIGYVFSVLIGYFIFHESIPLTLWIGLAFVVAGVILIVWNR